MAIKLEGAGGGGKALEAGALKKNFFLRLPYDYGSGGIWVLLSPIINIINLSVDILVQRGVSAQTIYKNRCVIAIDTFLLGISPVLSGVEGMGTAW